MSNGSRWTRIVEQVMDHAHRWSVSYQAAAEAVLPQNKWPNRDATLAAVDAGRLAAYLGETR